MISPNLSSKLNSRSPMLAIASMMHLLYAETDLGLAMIALGQ
jgi:hypothetical protein